MVNQMVNRSLINSARLEQSVTATRRQNNGERQVIRCVHGKNFATSILSVHYYAIGTQQSRGLSQSNKQSAAGGVRKLRWTRQRSVRTVRWVSECGERVKFRFHSTQSNVRNTRSRRRNGRNATNAEARTERRNWTELNRSLLSSHFTLVQLRRSECAFAFATQRHCFDTCDLTAAFVAFVAYFLAHFLRRLRRFAFNTSANLINFLACNIMKNLNQNFTFLQIRLLADIVHFKYAPTYLLTYLLTKTWRKWPTFFHVTSILLLHYLVKYRNRNSIVHNNEFMSDDFHFTSLHYRYYFSNWPL